MATARRDTARVTSLGDTRRVEHGVDQLVENGSGWGTEDVPAVRDRDEAVPRDDDENLPAEPVAGPDVGAAAVVAPPLIPVAWRTRGAGSDVVDVPLRRFACPAG